jgi:endonuclease G, mitochondrial
MNKFKSLNPVFIVVMLLLLFSCKEFNSKTPNDFSDKEENQNKVDENNEMDKSSFNYLPTSTSNVIIKHKYYTLSYCEKYEQAEWVAYELKKNEIGHLHLKRPYFIDDPLVDSGSASWRNYNHSGYDRGHLCPAGDRKFSKEAFDETFFTSNISPQKNEFNAGIWNTLEGKTRYWATKYDGIYVITGGVLQPNLETIGNEDVAVPEYFYKILLDNSRGGYKMIAFLLPSEDSSKPLYEFVVSVDEVEKMTGIDFFPSLPDDVENRLEKKSDYKDWSF